MRFLIIVLISSMLVFYGCSGSSKNVQVENYDYEKKSVISEPEQTGIEIINTAKSEQLNEMYSRDKDSVYLYWLESKLLVLNQNTKCNIFALNVLFKSGCRCPQDNALSADLFDTSKFLDIFPVVKYQDESDLRKGDLIIWNGHVIIFDSFVNLAGQDYAIAYWAGTNQDNDGTNIINGVVHGRYPLNGDFIVRRPLKK